MRAAGFGRLRGALALSRRITLRANSSSGSNSSYSSSQSTTSKMSSMPHTNATGTGLLYQSGHRGRPASAEMVAFLAELRQGTGQGSVELRRSDRDDRVLELVLRNERSRNSLTGRMMCQLHDIVHELTCPSSKQYQGCCALILRGDGSTFCSGADFHLAAKISSPAQGLLMADLMTTTLTRLRRAPLITVACLGNALGGGAELSTTADFRVMAPGSKVQFVQARMGVSCGWGGTSRLVRLVGRRKALQLLGAAVPLDAAQAEAAGFADLVCEEGEELEHATWRLLHPFLRHTTEALRSIKMGVAAADDLGWDAARDVETDAFRLTWGSEANKHALKTARERIASASSSSSSGAVTGPAVGSSKKKRTKEH